MESLFHAFGLLAQGIGLGLESGGLEDVGGLFECLEAAFQFGAFGTRRTLGLRFAVTGAFAFGTLGAGFGRFPFGFVVGRRGGETGGGEGECREGKDSGVVGCFHEWIGKGGALVAAYGFFAAMGSFCLCPGAACRMGGETSPVFAMQLIFDAHLDLSLNAMEWNRDLRLPVAKIREIESGMTDMKGRALGTVALPDMRAGGMGICVATQIGGTMKPRGPVACWESPAQAWAMTQAQLAWYRVMEELGEMREIRDLAALREHLALWADPADAAAANAPIGYIRSLEGADSIVTLAYLERAWNDGLRALGPSHYGEGRYAMGHDRVGGLKPEGRDLVREMDRLGMILDVTHLSDDSFWEALEIFTGPVWASHSNCRSLVPDVRQFTDDQLKALIERGAVIGAVFDAWMVVPGWIRGTTMPEDLGVKISHVVDHIDHICQLAGNANHVGIGTDLDGGFGREQSPMDLDTIADIQTVAGILADRGYSAEDVTKVMSGNYLALLERAWG